MGKSPLTTFRWKYEVTLNQNACIVFYLVRSVIHTYMFLLKEETEIVSIVSLKDT
jgi:hypothetical protein